MASGKPIVRQIAILPLIIQILYIIIFIFLMNLLFPQGRYNIEFALLLYILVCLVLRYTLTYSHRKGVRCYKKGVYNLAIPEFLKSYDFFTRHNWLDKYRHLFLMSGSRISYKEMALLNAAFCYSQIGEGDKAKEFYEKALAEYPTSQMAQSALNLINSVSKNSQ